MGVILIAFERESELSLIDQMLTQRGHQVIRSGNGLAALETARRGPPHAIVCDIVLPRMDGFALCRKWKQDERLRPVPFIFYTRRHDDPKYERFALELGAERFLARSVPPEALVTALDQLLNEAVSAGNEVPGSRAEVPSVGNHAPGSPAEVPRAAKATRVGRTPRLAGAVAPLLDEAVEARVAAVPASTRGQRGVVTQRALMDALADGCWVLDSAGQLLEVNQTYCRLSGYSRDELLKMTAAQIEDQSAGDTTLRLQLGRVNGGERYESKHRRADGTLMDVEITVGLLEGEPGDSIALIRDVSERRRELIAQRTQQRQLQFLLELFQQSEKFDESAIMRRVVEQAAEVTRSPLAYLYLVDRAQQTLTLAAWHERAQRISRMTHSAPRPVSRAGLFSECVRAGRASFSNDLSSKPQTDGLPDLQRYLAVPLLDERDTVAVLGVGNREVGYVEQDQNVLIALAEGVWRVLQAKRTQAQMLSSLQRTDVALQGMIEAMVRMHERHDPYTAGSGRRLAALAVALGREAGLDGERQHALRVAALLHDIGNIGVPASILAKPAPLNEAEMALMRNHVEEARGFLAGIDFGAPVLDIIYQMHERQDGSGYPRGLHGEQIMLEARILAIADTVEAMCSPRPYRPARGMEQALEEINRGAGRLYDPQLVAACTRLVRQHGFTLPDR